MYVEESVHMIFDEIDHLAEKDTQAAHDENFGLTQVYDDQSNQELSAVVTEKTQEPSLLEGEHDVQ